MASAQKKRGGQMIPGVLEPGLFGWNPSEVAQMQLHEYIARVLAKLCGAALAQAKTGNGRLVNYLQLPGSIWPALLEYWNVEFSPDDTARMLGAAQLDAKNPVLPFTPDSQAKRGSASAETHALAQRWMDAVYQQLEAQRQTGGFASADA